MTLLQTDDPREELLDAILLLPPAARGEGEAIRAWLAALPAPRLGAWPDLALATAITFDQQRLTLRAAGATMRMAGPTRGFLESAGGAGPELRALDHVLADLDPIALGSWLETGPQGVDGGWFLPAPMHLDQILTLLPVSDARDGLLDWARGLGIDQCLGLRRSVNAAAPYTELTLPLPDGDALEQVTRILLLFEALDVPTPPEAVRRALLREVETPLAVSAWLLPEGLAQLSILIHDPGEALLTALGVAVGHPLDRLRPFTNALGAGHQPMAVELQRTADAWVAELHVEVREHEPPN